MCITTTLPLGTAFTTELDDQPTCTLQVACDLELASAGVSRREAHRASTKHGSIIAAVRHAAYP